MAEWLEKRKNREGSYKGRGLNRRIMVHRIKRQRASRTEHKLVVEVVHKEKGWQRLGYIFWSWKNEPGMFAK